MCGERKSSCLVISVLVCYPDPLARKTKIGDLPSKIGPAMFSTLLLAGETIMIIVTIAAVGISAALFVLSRW